MKCGEMFPNRYLRGQDMAGPLLIVVNKVVTERVRSGAGRPEETKYVLRFELAKVDRQPAQLSVTSHPPEGYGLVLRKTLAEEIFHATGTTDTDEWAGHKIVIYSAKERAAGRDVITIHARGAEDAGAGD